ncbi:hypothetical protein G7085_02455 [Tessaracoccus sp. HDW20]|nr:histidine kinase [Tessaracoccus coleopterorum]NHB83917.1 hypothetical protein [Tessaracoccus coleopterorum]
MLVTVASGVWVVVDLVLRARRAQGATRSQLVALLPAGVLVLAGIVVEALGPSYATVPGLVAVPVGMGVAILAHRLDDLDLAVNRTLVWLVSTLTLFAAFAVAVSLLSATALADQPLVVTGLAAVAVALGFDPLRRRVQAGVDRLLFGDRSRPHQVLLDLGRRMQGSADPGGLLTDLVGAVEASLRVPYVRMEVHDPDGEVLTVFDSGRPQADADAVEAPMLAHGERVGSLRVAPRGRGERFTAAETRLLTDIAGQAAIAARSYRVTLDLLEARSFLVRSREAERLRIRRDLHDGLGPAIAGARMQVAAARQPGAADGLLGSVQETLTECSQEVRRIVDGLRPGALDRGLVPALEQRVAGMGPEPSVRVDASGTSPGSTRPRRWPPTGSPARPCRTRCATPAPGTSGSHWRGGRGACCSRWSTTATAASGTGTAASAWSRCASAPSSWAAGSGSRAGQRVPGWSCRSRWRDVVPPGTGQCPFRAGRRRGEAEGTRTDRAAARRSNPMRPFTTSLKRIAIALAFGAVAASLAAPAPAPSQGACVRPRAAARLGLDLCDTGRHPWQHPGPAVHQAQLAVDRRPPHEHQRPDRPQQRHRRRDRPPVQQLLGHGVHRLGADGAQGQVRRHHRRHDTGQVGRRREELVLEHQRAPRLLLGAGLPCDREPRRLRRGDPQPGHRKRVDQPVPLASRCGLPLPHEGGPDHHDVPHPEPPVTTVGGR